MAEGRELLSAYPALAAVANQLDRYLETRHPSFFGRRATHPVLPVRRSKIIHDNLWGTNRFTWIELAVIDSPIIQRLRDIHQTGLAYHVYPSARHSRFEHVLGVTTIASRVFDALLDRHGSVIRGITRTLYGKELSDDEMSRALARFRQELRLAALLHDTGHCLFSHASERVYKDLSGLKDAADELTLIVGKEKGVGEVISFCIALSASLTELIDRARAKISDDGGELYTGDVSLVSVALMIVGRSVHPLLQFCGDIISSGFDADKLDYLLRDAGSAGLPLRIYILSFCRKSDSAMMMESLTVCIGWSAQESTAANTKSLMTMQHIRILRRTVCAYRRRL
jgi:HD superfamily phosphohydrolase